MRCDVNVGCTKTAYVKFVGADLCVCPGFSTIAFVYSGRITTRANTRVSPYKYSACLMLMKKNQEKPKIPLWT